MDFQVKLDEDTKKIITAFYWELKRFNDNFEKVTSVKLEVKKDAR